MSCRVFLYPDYLPDVARILSAVLPLSPALKVEGVIMRGVAKSKKALNHKDTKTPRKPFLSAGRSPGMPGKNFVHLCLCGSLLFRGFCNALEGRNPGLAVGSCRQGCGKKSKYPS